MQSVTCNYCGVDNSVLVNYGPDLLLNLPGDFYLVRCLNCDLIYQNPQLTIGELSNHYPKEYLPYREDIRKEKSALRRLDQSYGLARTCRRVIQHHPQTGRLLDVGCATGLFMNAMRQRGWEVTGVDLSPYAAQYARRNFNLEVEVGTIEDIAYASDTFDLVTLWDVLEHVPDPRATLKEIARVLKPEGMLALSLPNPVCIEARLFGSYWVGWDRPRHLHLFTPAVLARYLQDSGFELISLQSYSGRLGLTLLSLEFYLKAKGIPEKRWRHWLKLLYNWPLRMATWPVYRLGEIYNQTTSMTAFARLTATD
jgi:2-polyprenyl-3-methyl-5-hydroxy-6-metoxy-1,4-benzoquinol methylase